MKNFWINKTEDIDSVCDRMQDYLNTWYHENKYQLKQDAESKKI